MATDTVMAAGTAMATSTTLAAEKSSAAEAAFRNFGSRNSFRSYRASIAVTACALCNYGSRHSFSIIISFRALAAGIAEPVGKCRKNQLFKFREFENNFVNISSISS